MRAPTTPVRALVPALGSRVRAGEHAKHEPRDVGARDSPMLGQRREHLGQAGVDIALLGKRDAVEEEGQRVKQGDPLPGAHLDSERREVTGGFRAPAEGSENRGMYQGRGQVQRVSGFLLGAEKIGKA